MTPLGTAGVRGPRPSDAARTPGGPPPGRVARRPGCRRPGWKVPGRGAAFAKAPGRGGAPYGRTPAAGGDPVPVLTRPEAAASDGPARGRPGWGRGRGGSPRGRARWGPGGRRGAAPLWGARGAGCPREGPSPESAAWGRGPSRPAPPPCPGLGSGRSRPAACAAARGAGPASGTGFHAGLVPLCTRKAEEYLRLSQVRCARLAARATGTGGAVVCLDLAASCAKCPVDRVSGRRVGHTPA